METRVTPGESAVLERPLSQPKAEVSAWRALFGKEADELEQASDDDQTYYIIEKDCLVNVYISVPKENSTSNCADFTGVIQRPCLPTAASPPRSPSIVTRASRS